MMARGTIVHALKAARISKLLVTTQAKPYGCGKTGSDVYFKGTSDACTALVSRSLEMFKHLVPISY